MLAPKVIQIPEVYGFLFEPHRYKVAYGGRGSAKSHSFARSLVIQGAQDKLRILCAREIQKSIADSVHHLLKQVITEMGYSWFYEITENTIRGKNGTTFIFNGLRTNVDQVKSLEGVDICWVEEAHKVTKKSWETLIPTIRKDGSEIWVSFNPDQEHDNTWQRFCVNHPTNSHVVKTSWRDNPWFTSVLQQEMQDMKANDNAAYLHVWEGEFNLVADQAIYGENITKTISDGRITSIPIIDSIPVHTFWDLGKNDTTAIWFMQAIGIEYRFVDYYEHRLVDIPHYLKVLRDKSYLWGEHYMPHDVEVSVLGMGNRTRRQIFEEGGLDQIRVVPRINDVNEGIAMTRDQFSRCWFDEERCKDGIRALSNYQYTFDEKHDVLRKLPLHNWASNGADAFRQFAQGFTVENKTQHTGLPTV